MQQKNVLFIRWGKKNQIQTCSGAMMPGQLGPIKRDLFCSSSRRFTLTMSCWGMPSVMQTTNGISASKASIIADAAAGGGTYITEAVAPVASFACLQESNKLHHTSKTQFLFLIEKLKIVCQYSVRKNSIVLIQMNGKVYDSLQFSN